MSSTGMYYYREIQVIVRNLLSTLRVKARLKVEDRSK